MKSNRKSIFALIVTALAVFSCMYTDDIIFPEGDIKVNSEIEVLVKVHCEPGSDLANTPMVIGILTPKSWDLGNNAELYLTTEGYTTQGGADVQDEKMILIPADEKEFSSGMNWSDAFQNKLGALGNTGTVQWTAWKSATAFTINDKLSTENIYATVKVKMKTGPKNIKFFFGAGWCSYNRGFDDGDDSRYQKNSLAKVMTVSGGSGNDDYTVFHFFSTTPADVRYGDIFALNLKTEVDGVSLNLKGENEIYYALKATLADGSTVELSDVSDKTLLIRQEENSYFRYIYPKEMLNLPASAEITSLDVYFVNKDKSIVCRDTDPVTGEPKDFQVPQSENKIK